jgi:3-oxoisoapionate decarboxylase
MRCGIGSYTFTWAVGVPGHPPARPVTALELLDEARRLGVGVVQFCENLPLTRLAPEELERLQAMSQSAGLVVEVGTRSLNSANLRTNLDLVRRFGGSFLRLVIDQAGDEPSPEEVVTRLEPLKSEFTAVGVRLAIENHDRFPSAVLARIVQQLGRDYAGICLDTVNSFGALEGPPVVVENLGEYVLCLHAKDFIVRRVSHQMGFVLEGCPLGRGRLELVWLLDRLKGCPNQFDVILENWVTPSDSLDETIHRERAWAEEGVRFLQRAIPT